jgi:nucleotide-binding universal stress UspA family protein
VSFSHLPRIPSVGRWTKRVRDFLLARAVNSCVRLIAQKTIHSNTFAARLRQAACKKSQWVNEMRVLVAYDGSTCADAAIDDLTRAGLPKDTEALVVCVGDGASTELAEIEPTKQRDFWKSRLTNAQELGNRAVTRLCQEFPRWTVLAEALWGLPAKIILETSARWHPDLIVVGSHGRSPVARLFLGSVSTELIHKATCSVRVARKGGSAAADPPRIVIGHDGSAEAEKVVRSVAARSWPKNTQAQIVSVAQTLVPVIATLEASTYAQEPAYSVVREADERLKFRLNSIAAESANRLRRSGLSAEYVVVEGDPREVILAAAQDLRADAIFVGARGLSGMKRLFLGSVSTHLVTHAHCTVEIVRTPPA